MEGSFYGSTWGSSFALSYPLYEDLRENNQVFSGMFCRFPTRVGLGFGERTERVATLMRNIEDSDWLAVPELGSIQAVNDGASRTSEFEVAARQISDLNLDAEGVDQ